ncbi:putative Nucleic acid-binding; OB-fold [Paratrimastix pyriformis]|uniref:Nucleic acid-binding n=1 Tax=Paratrimastix pyriformis TaxID=342808 RepID=A0ABQ8UIN3_9EUKA|nr:putative Nucleic acid-binding; OB-fold [Paratrimastix pyriformis]
MRLCEARQQAEHLPPNSFDESHRVDIVGKVVSRRDHAQVTFIKIQSHEEGDDPDATVQLLILKKTAPPALVALLPILHPEFIGRWTGHLGRSKTGEISLQPTAPPELLRSPTDPAYLAKVLELTAQANITPVQAADMMDCALEDIIRLLEMPLESPARRRELVIVSHLMQGLPARGLIRARIQKLGLHDRMLLERAQRAAAGYPVRLLPGGGETVDFGAVDPLLNLPEQSGDRVNYIDSKKRPQIAWMLGQLKDLLASLPPTPPPHLFDIGGGRGDLALVIATSLPQLAMTVVDTNEPSLAAGRARAVQLGLGNIEFVSGSLADPPVQQSILGCARPVMVGLHACGGLSDLILDTAARAGASVLLCTCCFASHPDLLDGCLHQEPWGSADTGDCPPNPEVGAALGTQGPDPAGSPIPFSRAEWARLGQLAEMADHPEEAHRAMGALNALRLARFGRCLARRGPAGRTMAACEILAFPLEYSPRNLVLRVAVR